jgi:serine/threonine-protein kinase
MGSPVVGYSRAEYMLGRTDGMVVVAAPAVVLKIEKGPQQGREFVFSTADRFLVGRALGSHLRLPDEDPSVSRNHCLVEICPPNAILHDLQSSNGTFVNGKAISSAFLKAGDEIRMGATLLRVLRVPQVAESSAGADGLCAELPPRLMPARTVPGIEMNQATRCVECEAEAAHAQTPLKWRWCPYLCASCAQKHLRKECVELCGEYAILDVIGQGGMGVVCKAWHRGHHRLVALKRLRPPALGDDRARRQFRREIAVLRELTHPNIVGLLDEGREGKESYLVSEFMAGGDLGHLVESVRQAPLGVNEGARYMCQALDGLLWAHERGFVHRDVKPANILLSSAVGGTAKLADFGLAKGFAQVGMSMMTQCGEGAGTILYMAPEQILNYRFVKPPADVYSIGVSFYYLLTGQLPFNFPSPLDRILGNLAGIKAKNELRIVLEDDPIPVRKRKHGLPTGLAEVIDRSVRKDERERFQSAAEMKLAIEQACRMQPDLPALNCA